ncbi:MAG: M20 family metallopeptidase [Candidatus Parvarchaeota archaeon]|jgi:succinyl-diaminopimelate desuccinylase|nr:M20 family metallopeptidase [Candidatus Parvarchaeota archaeon]MCL5420480.1 M20 family metallopeptidase [Candidatus Parvarchaeota archaeon]
MDEIRLTQELVKIPSENPPGNERKIAEFVANFLDNLDIKNEIVEIDQDRFNVIAEIGKGEGLALSSHMDTVPVGDVKTWKHGPFSGDISDGKVYGRGTTDTKGGLSSILTALSRVDLKNPERRLVLLFVCDEEVDSRGSKWIINNRKKFLSEVKYGITTEATNNKIRIAQKGLVQVRVKFSGKAAHASKPWMGKNAVDDAVRFISELHRRKKHLLGIKDDMLGNGTINIGRIVGGVKVNMVPGSCEVDIDRRIVYRETPSLVLRDYEKILKDLKIRAKIEQLCEPIWPFKLNKDSKIISMISSAIKTEVVGDTGYTEAELYSRRAGIDFVAFGPGNSTVAHAADEYVEVSKLKHATSMLESLIKTWLTQ